MKRKKIYYLNHIIKENIEIYQNFWNQWKIEKTLYILLVMIQILLI